MSTFILTETTLSSFLSPQKAGILKYLLYFQSSEEK